VWVGLEDKNFPTIQHKILSKFNIRHIGIQVAIARRDQSDVNRDGTCAAGSVDFAFLERAKQLGLNWKNFRLTLQSIAMISVGFTRLLIPFVER